MLFQVDPTARKEQELLCHPYWDHCNKEPLEWLCTQLVQSDPATVAFMGFFSPPGKPEDISAILKSCDGFTQSRILLLLCPHWFWEWSEVTLSKEGRNRLC